MCRWMSRDALQVEVVHTQFRVSEDHKLRAMLKKQSAKVVFFLLRVSCGEII